jgi:hypothetical protein
VSRAVSEVIQHTAIDYRPDLDELRKQMHLRATKQELAGALKAQTGVIEALRIEQNSVV